MKKTSLYLAIMTTTLALTSCTDTDDSSANAQNPNAKSDLNNQQIITEFEFDQPPNSLISKLI